jgi:hypothetical protein
MAYAPSWRVVMNEDVMAKLDVLIGMVGELQADQRSLKNSTNSLKEPMNDLREREREREREDRPHGRTA